MKIPPNYKTRLLSLILVPAFCLNTQAQTFSQFLSQLFSLPDSLRPALVDSFMNANPELPLIEGDTAAHFIYNNPANSVNIPGDFNDWNPNSDPMSGVSGTNFHYRSKAFEPDARLDYKFVLNGSNWILDPYNSHNCYGGFGPNSELAMPQYIYPPEILYYPEIPHGAIEDTVFYSQNLGNSRTVKIYLPPDYAVSGASYPYIIFHDGLEYLSLAHANNTLDYCIYQQSIVPIIAVFVPPVNRTEEYAATQQDAFTAFIVSELIPYIDAQYRTIPSPASRATLGPSYGGNISLHLGITHPDVISLLAPQSPYVEPEVLDTLENGQMQNLDFYIDAGTYEPFILNPVEANLIPALQTRGYPYQYNVYHEGHSWGNWKAHVDNALIRFFPGPAANAGKNLPLPKKTGLLLNYPNPFNERTNIIFELPAASSVSLDLFNSEGQKIARLLDGDFPPGFNSTHFTGEHLATGLYFLRMDTEFDQRIQKILLLK